MPKIQVNIDVNKYFNKKFIPYLNNPERIVIFWGGAGSGKSIFILQKLILKCLKYNNRKVLMVRKTQASIRDSIFAELQNQIRRFKLEHLVKVNQTHMSVQFINGSQIITAGLDDVDKLKSISNISDIFIEEADQITEADFNQLNLRMRSNQPNQQIHIAFNPVSKNSWLYKRFFAPGIDDPDVVKVHSTYKDNKFLPPDYITEMEKLKDTDPYYYQVYALGQWASLDKLVFNNWEVAPCKDIATGTPFCGVDFGFSNDPTAIEMGTVDLGKKTIFVTDEYCSPGMFIEDIAKQLKRMGVGSLPVMCDSAEPRSIADLKRYGINARGVKKGKDSIIHGIEWLKTFKIIIDPSCKHLQQEMQDYSWMKDKKTGEYLNVPVGGQDHCIDALRYGTSLVRENSGKVIFLPKAALGL